MVRRDEPERSSPGEEVGAFPAHRAGLDRDLAGSLPCIRCGYELQGISVLGKCPECGLVVRATILHRVDPAADVVAPVRFPKVSAWGVRLWSVAGLLAGLTIFAMAIADQLASAAPSPLRRLGAQGGGVVLVTLAISALGLLMMVVPQYFERRRRALLGLVGVVAFAWIWYGFAWTQSVDEGKISFLRRAPEGDRISARLVFGGALAVMLLSARPTARALVRRSVALRTGRVDRQTIFAMVIAVGIGMVGDLLRLSAGTEQSALREPQHVVGVVLIVVSSLLVLLGLAGAVVDSLRIAKAIQIPALTLDRLLGADPQEG